jgi:hypothetical protein
MSLDRELNAAHLILTFAVDAAGIVPIAGNIVSALKLADDAVLMGEELVEWLKSPEASKVSTDLRAFLKGEKSLTIHQGRVPVFISPQISPEGSGSVM